MPQMKSPRMIEQIRKMAAAGHKVRRIAKALEISRNTVRKHLRSLEAVAEVGQTGATASADAPGRPSWAAALPWDDLLRQRQKGVTLKQLYAEFEPAISYSRFCRTLRATLTKLPEVAPRLVHNAGERVQIDFADGLLLTDPSTGTKTKTHLFCGVLPFSSYVYAEFVKDQKLPSFIRCHENMWAFFGA